MNADPIRIAVHHRYPFLRDCLVLALSQHFAAEVTPLCAQDQASSICRAVTSAKPDLVLLDLDALQKETSAAGTSTASLVKAIRLTCFNTKIVALSENESYSFINATLCAWVDAYLIASHLRLSELFAACEAVQAGALYLCAQSKRILSDTYAHSIMLTAREIEIVRLLAAHPHDEYQRLANMLHVTGGTMRTHLANLRLKLDVQNNHEMVAAVRTLGLIE